MDNSSILEHQAQIRQNILKSVVADETYGLFEKAKPQEDDTQGLEKEEDKQL
jgi:hypothetical protein